MKNKKSVRRRITPKQKAGISNFSAPFWIGDTAERILKNRLRERELRASQKKSRRRSGSTRTTRVINGDPDLVRTLKRLERVLPKRKTIAARKRVEKRIKELKVELGI